MHGFVISHTVVKCVAHQSKSRMFAMSNLMYTFQFHAMKDPESMDLYNWLARYVKKCVHHSNVLITKQ